MATSLAVALLAGVADAAAKLPKPATAGQVAARVAASTSIERLPTGLVPPLGELPSDQPRAYYGVAGRECDGMTSCVFGDRSSRTTVVLFGDSHAMMWLPALVPVALADHVRLVLTWRPGCPAATVTVWDPVDHSVATGCNVWRAAQLHVIAAAHPFLVLLASRTSNIPGAGNRPTTDAAWQAGLEQTISALKSPTTRVAVIGDITALDADAATCLAAYPTSVQRCSVPNPNPRGY
jgi:hypothetical protein